MKREASLWAEDRLLVGVDEAGRGPLAGPVVAAAVVFPARVRRVRGLRDSKILPARKRQRLAGRIERSALAVGVGAASTREIDRLNIRRASALAMRRAILRACRTADCGPPPTAGVPTPFQIVVDGLPLPEIGLPHEALVDGDALCYTIAAAGVVAKTIRDRLMTRLGRRHPAYKWESNKGYATAAHREAIAACGPSAHHRYSFEPVCQLTFGV